MGWFQGDLSEKIFLWRTDTQTDRWTDRRAGRNSDLDDKDQEFMEFVQAQFFLHGTLKNGTVIILSAEDPVNAESDWRPQLIDFRMCDFYF